MNTNKYAAFFDRFIIELTGEQARYGNQPGDVSSAIQELLEEENIRRQLDDIPADDIRAELKEQGAWSDEELEDDQYNRSRILWIACGEVREEFHL